MRKLLLLGFCISLFVPTAMQAQYLRSSYFMEGSSTRMQLNPASQPKRGYVNLPVIGSLTAEVSSNSLGIQDVIDIFDSDGEFYNNDKFYNRLKGMNELNISLNTDVISFGFYKGKSFWSFNVGARVDVDATIPKTMFEYLRAVDVENFNWEGQQAFNIQNEKLRLNSYIEVGAGYSRAINERLTIGGKAKLLLGAGNINLKINQLYISAKEAGIDSELQLKADAYLEASAKGLDLEEENGYITDLDNNNFGISGYGAGFDLGASYQVMKNLTFSAAILDLGFISWGKSSTQIAESNKNTIINKDNYGDSSEVLDFELYGLQKKENKSRTTSLSPTMVLGGEYGLLDNKLGLGLLSTTRFGQLKTYSELTLSANYRPNTLINASLSYSMIQGGETFGIAFKVGPLMLGTDYMYFGNNSKHVNAFIGLSIPLGKKSSD
ncbi:DUF5723 family protein [Bacteroides oleiciplenus]|uniref:DUF5723 domain-containing protein n=1 Tax=Bacteroides oleiciplenus YIT 12058 TaxID=742727 RepID=K9E1L1_9BACE|nr:DUF5723 family protein [Bacteroides oleiciplenus]EKU89556.1 hypothetical protein HMPREF9447_02994 [Bacteroides oleiciplenus YIT 12058]